MKFLVVLNIMILVGMGGSFAFDAYEDYFDPVLYYLLNGNDTGLSELHDTYSGESDVENTPVFLDGIWKCGNCNKATENRLIYKEINDVDTNIDEDNFLHMQVGLAFDEMRCVAVQSDEENCQVKRITGACTGPTVTLHVSNAQHFDVRVYRD